MINSVGTYTGSVFNNGVWIIDPSTNNIAGNLTIGTGAIRQLTNSVDIIASNLINPLIISADRFVIAATVSVAAVTFYVTPYEVITKGWILSASLLGALFPVFSTLAHSEPGSIRGACRWSTRRWGSGW